MVVIGILQHLSPALCLCSKISQITGLIKENQAKRVVLGKKALDYAR
jgi:hypothetical protein